MNYPEEKQTYIDGVRCEYLCHIQECEGVGNVFPAHYHDYIELLYGISGEFQVHLGGQYHQFCGEDMVLINAKEVHKIDSLSKEGGKYIVVRFLPELIYNSMSSNHFEMKYMLPFVTENSSNQKVIQEKILGKTEIPKLFHEIVKEVSEEKYGYELAVKNHIGRIFLWILRYWDASRKDNYEENAGERDLRGQLQPALKYVTEQYSRDIKAEEMAKLCHMSYSYFSRSFHRIMKMTFREYLNHIRIWEAEKMLVSTSLSITEIGGEVGFATTSYFIKMFQSYKHITPKQFRKLIVWKE